MTLPLIACFVLIALVSLFFLFDVVFKQKKQKASYQKILNYLDLTVELCNHNYSPILRTQQLKLIDYFCGTLSVLENLLLTVRHLDPRGAHQGAYQGALFLAKDCYLRGKRVENALHDFRKKGSFDTRKLYDQFKPGGLNKVGCYFCSRPYEAHFFTQTKAVVDGKRMAVIACKICDHQLKQNNKARILKFIRDGKALHWSKIVDYRPKKEYWNLNLNKDYYVTKTKHLSVIHTKRPPLK